MNIDLLWPVDAERFTLDDDAPLRCELERVRATLGRLIELFQPSS